MSFPHDRTSLGDLIAQHHDPFGTWGGEQASRRRQGRVRFVGFDKTTGEPTYDRYGWHHGDVCWLATGQGNNLAVNVWQQAFPALIMPSSGGTTSGPGYKSSVVGPLAQPVLKQQNGIWVPDTGLLPQAGALPIGLQLPYGYPVVALGMSTLDEQQLALVPAGGILIAVKAGGAANGVYGTRVYDVRGGGMDFARWARDHSHWCVYLLPRTTLVDFPFGGQLVDSKQAGGAAPGGLAWELGPDVDQQGGHGVVADLPTKAGAPTPAVNDGSQYVIQLANGQYAVTNDPTLAAQTGIQGSIGGIKYPAIPVNSPAGQLILASMNGGVPTTQEKTNPQTSPPKTQEKPTNGGTPQTTSRADVLAVASYRGRGPLCVGEQDDVHQLATTPDGVAVNSLHDHEDAIVIGDTGDAPRKHDKGAWVPVRPDGPFTHEVYHRVDPTDSHEWMGKTKPQLRKWQGTDFADVPTPAADPRPEQPVSGGGTREKFPDPKPKPKPKPEPEPPGPDNKWDPDPPPPGGGPIPPDFGGGLTPPPVLPPDGGGDPSPSPPPGGYFGPDGTPLIFPPGSDGQTPGQLPGPTTGPEARQGGTAGSDGLNPGGSFNPPVEPANPGGNADGGGRQNSYPAFGPSMGFYEMIARGTPLQDDVRDPRYQFDSYTPEERKAYDNGPAGLKVNGFVATSGGAPTYDGPQCGPGNLVTGTSPRGGISYEASDSDLPGRLRNERDDKTTQWPRNEGIVNHGRNVGGSFGDINEDGRPANGFHYGRSYDDATGAKYASLEETDGDGKILDSPLAVLLDFLLQKAYLWGNEIITTATLPATNGGPGLFGDGSDGAALFNGSAVTGCTFDGAITYTLSRDVYFTDMTMSGSYRLITNGYRLYVNGTLTVGASNNINNDGAAAVGATQGAAGTAQTIGAGFAGAGGFTAGPPFGSNGTAGTASTPSFGGSGGAGGNAFLNTGGAGGAATAPAANYGELRQAPQIVKARLESYQGDVALEGGAGGGAGALFLGAGAVGVSNSGGGGGGAGVVMIAAKTLINNGNITARGGPGGAATVNAGGAANSEEAGGGGGGGGGLICLVYVASGSTLGSLLVTGGNGGAGATNYVAVPAPNGTAGSSGRTRVLAL
jgi:hypothetical protein